MNKIIYLDAAATYQKSDAVIATEMDFLRNKYANAGRGICSKAIQVDEMVDGVRKRVANFINARPDQVVFTAGTTDAFNRLIAMIRPDENTVVAVSVLDHHSACLPWVAAGVKTVVWPMDKQYNFDLNQAPYADVVVVTAMSNVLGVGQNVAEIVRVARRKNPNVIVVVDAAQYVVHQKIDVREWDCDFVAWSGHKIGADTGVGVLYIKHPDKVRADRFGGGMVSTVSGTTFVLEGGPAKFEAGTLPLTQIAGLGVAIDEIERNRPDLNLIKYMYDSLSEIDGVKMVSLRDASLLTWYTNKIHVLDFGVMVGGRGICLRVGKMCASWIHQALGLDGTIRISVGAYNNKHDVEQAIDIIKDVLK